MTITAAIDRAGQRLQAEQVAGNHWVGRLSSSARATALAVIALHLAGRGQYHLAGRGQYHLAGRGQYHLAGRGQYHLAGRGQYHLAGRGQYHL
ncbi:MAG: hypothetical protein K1X65_07680, partial [Caldilineales bacterium]|nr:hypothetical protein [Caldilineales bacterium]